MVDLLHNLVLPPDHILVSLDVVSLFTNVPHDLAITDVKKRWSRLRNDIPVPQAEFIKALNICFRASIFKFNGVNFAQQFGLPMGSLLSPILSDLVMDDLEQACLGLLSFKPPVFYRYVDDILTAVPRDSIIHLLHVFNNYHPRLQFTCETEHEGCISFLDVKIFNDNSTLLTDWFHIATWSQRYLNFRSHHPISYTIGTITNLVDRAIRLSDPIFHDKNLNLIYDVQRSNGYPHDLLCKHIRRRRLSVLAALDSNNNDTGALALADAGKKFISIPYVSGLFESLNWTLSKHNIRLVGTSNRDLSFLFDSGKDTLPFDNRSNVIYKIPCMNCNGVYIGQTYRQVGTRVKEHKKNVNEDVSRHTALTKHMVDLNHAFNYDNISILDEEPRSYKRLLLEMCHIGVCGPFKLGQFKTGR